MLLMVESTPLRVNVERKRVSCHIPNDPQAPLDRQTVSHRVQIQLFDVFYLILCRKGIHDICLIGDNLVELDVVAC